MEVPLEIPDFQELESTLFQLLKGERAGADTARRLHLHIHSWVSEPQLRYHEQRIWALKSDERHTEHSSAPFTPRD